MFKHLTEYTPEISTENFKLSTNDFKIQDLFDVYIDENKNIMLKAKSKVFIVSDDDIGIISKKDITLISGNALGSENGFISFNPVLDNLQIKE